MTRIKRGGRELVVPDTDVAAYLSEGYAVIDDQGNELTKAQATTFSQLKAEHDTLKLRLDGAIAQAEAYKKEIAEKDATIAALKTQAEALQNELDAIHAQLADAGNAEHPGKQAGNTQATAKASSGTKSSSGAKPAQKG